MNRIALWTFAILLTVGISAIFVVQSAAPASHGLPELSIGDPSLSNENVYMSGKQFDCTASEVGIVGPGTILKKCSTTLLGDPLTVAFRAEQSTGATGNFALTGDCAATYRGETHRCQQGVHRGTSRGIAVIPDGLSLSDAELATLRAEHAIENDTFARWPLIIGYAITLALAAIALAMLSNRPQSRLQKLALSVPVALFTVAVTYVAALWATTFLWS